LFALRYFLISLVISSDPHWLFNSVLLATSLGSPPSSGSSLLLFYLDKLSSFTHSGCPLSVKIILWNYETRAWNNDLSSG
jgi:hypothetical protein